MSVEPARDDAGRFDIVAVAASLGGLDALTRLLKRIPPGFGAPVLVVQHLSAKHSSRLAQVLALRTRHRVVQACDGLRPERGAVYVAPPDRHLLIGPDRCLRLSSAAKINFARPAADATFQSIAEQHGPRAIAVVLTGRGRDGARGVEIVKHLGGRVFVASPEECVASGMPDAAINTGCVDFVLPLETIGSALTTLVMVPGAAELFEVRRPLPALSFA